MKKLVKVMFAVVLVGCVVALFTACGAKDEDIITTTTLTTTNATADLTTDDAIENGKVTDESEKGENGALGDAVTDISEGVSDMMTDASEDISEVME